MNIISNGSKVLLISLFFSAVSVASASEQPDGEQLFKKKCSICHAIDKKKLGPAVNSMSNDEEVLRQVSTKGRKSMPAYEGKLTGAEIDALVRYLLENQQEG